MALKQLLAVFVASSSCLLMGLHAFQDDQKLQKDTMTFMDRKLEASKAIVSGLATEDFDSIAKSAQELMLLSHEAEWKVIQSKTYLDMSSDFRGSADRLRENAQKKNLDGATLAYFEVTMNCVRCHKYLRSSAKNDNAKDSKKKN